MAGLGLGLLCRQFVDDIHFRSPSRDHDIDKWLSAEDDFIASRFVQCDFARRYFAT
jgi:hypothetical protein